MLNIGTVFVRPVATYCRLEAFSNCRHCELRAIPMKLTTTRLAHMPG